MLEILILTPFLHVTKCVWGAYGSFAYPQAIHLSDARFVGAYIVAIETKIISNVGIVIIRRKVMKMAH